MRRRNGQIPAFFDNIRLFAASTAGRSPLGRETLSTFNLVVTLGGALAALLIGLWHPTTLSAGQLPWLLLYAGLFQPAVEEFLFRGWLQGRLLSRPVLKQQRLGISGANLVTSALFVLAHCLYQPGIMSLLVAIPSLFYGISRERYGGITLPTVQHALHNSALFIGFTL